MDEKGKPEQGGERMTYECKCRVRERGGEREGMETDIMQGDNTIDGGGRGEGGEGQTDAKHHQQHLHPKR